MVYRQKTVFITALIALLICCTQSARAQNDSGQSSMFELGALGSLILPSSIPGTDEIYPSIGPHFAVRVADSIFEAQAIFGMQESYNAAQVGVTVNNFLIYVPFGFRFPFDKAPGYASLGFHGLRYKTHDAAASALSGNALGLYFGGGIIMKSQGMTPRLDLKFVVNPGWTVMISILGFFGLG